MDDNIPNLGRDLNIQLHESHRSQTNFKEILSKAYYIKLKKN